MHTVTTPTNQQRSIEVNKRLVSFCTTAVFLYALSRLWIGSQISGYIEAAFLIPFYYIVAKNWWYFKKQYLTWLAIAMLMIPILQFCIQYYYDPELALKYQGIGKLFKLTLFLAPAFWLAHNLKLVNWFIIANLIGLFILVLTQPDIYEYFLHALTGVRTSFKSINAQFISLYSGLGLISVIYLILKTNSIKSLWLKHTIFVTFIIAATLLSIVIIASQTRAAFLGIIAIIAITIVLLIKHQSWTPKQLLSHPRILVVTILLILSGLISTTYTTYPNRLLHDFKNFEKAYTEADSAIFNRMGSGRGELWAFTLNKTLQSPYIGWGGNSSINLLALSNNNFISNLHRSHNSWLDFGLSYGIPGIILLGSLLWAIIKIELRQWYLVQTANYTALLSILCLTYLTIMSTFESYFILWQGSYLLTWLASPSLAYAMSNKLTYR